MTSGSRRFARRTLVPLLGLALAVAPSDGAAPASAAVGGLAVSGDGVTYRADNALPIFPAHWRLVPGDVETSSVWVRNDGPSEARLRIDLVDPTTDDPVFAAGVEISAEPRPASVTSAASVAVGAAIDNGPCTVLSDDRVLAAGESARVDVTARVSAELSGLEGQRGTVGFGMRGVLMGATVGTPHEPGTPCGGLPVPPDAGELPRTGGILPGLALAVGAVAAATGVVVFSAARRRDPRGHDDA